MLCSPRLLKGGAVAEWSKALLRPLAKIKDCTHLFFRKDQEPYKDSNRSGILEFFYEPELSKIVVFCRVVVNSRSVVVKGSPSIASVTQIMCFSPQW